MEIIDAVYIGSPGCWVLGGGRQARKYIKNGRIRKK
jgi:hypothetical protein